MGFLARLIAELNKVQDATADVTVVVSAVKEVTDGAEMRPNNRRWFCLDSLVLTIGVVMPCKSCGSVNQSKFTAEMAIHFPGLKNIDKPVVWIFPELVACLDCGTAEFTVPEAELHLLGKDEGASAG